ncbi:MAG: SAM-dependent methyltransferase, partial [Prevotellaceae bacterium]|nr:SAM-dependent methyltransferase [Prevotellaceae bacterium]
MGIPTFSTATRDFIRAHSHEDVYRLALQAGRYPEVDMRAAVQQIDGRQRMEQKVPAWAAREDILYPPHLSVEQCSSEITARYKAEWIGGRTLVDLTGGLGVDTAFLSERFEQTTYVEENAELCSLARHNFACLQLPIETVHADATAYLRQMTPVDAIYIDPARRNDDGRKVAALSDCKPDILSLLPLLRSKASAVLLKLSPMLDISMAATELTPVSAVHVVAVRNECKEILVALSDPTPPEYPIRCVNLRGAERQTFAFYPSEERQAACRYADEVLNYLYEPNAAILKAGAFKLLAARFGLFKLHPNSHLYTSDSPIVDFPGRRFRVTAWGSGHGKHVVS